MKYSVIGSGSIGMALARRFSRSGIELGVANTRGAESLASLVNEFGNKVIPGSQSWPKQGAICDVRSDNTASSAAGP
ncbi:putative dinucleotide-binding enzyme [Paraburkholderia sp. EB58]|jgi:predicted dinucleotide-binding enzyme|uniref:NAD(P)-binding domain-containing protein n=1 Tax=Paraburkholderia sp. EB58 TaxID=3035125 RepID=UPI003D2284F6